MKGFSFSYVPEKLISTRDEMGLEISKSRAPSGEFFLKRLASRVQAIDSEDQLEDFVSEHKTSVIKELLYYANDQYMTYDSPNFYWLLKRKMRKSLQELLYEVVLNAFNEPTFNALLSDDLQHYIDQNPIKGVFVNFAINQYIGPSDFTKFLSIQGIEMNQCIERYEIHERTRFYEEVFKYYLTHGPKSFYETYARDALFKEALRYNTEVVAQFVNHYFSLYSLNKEFMPQCLELIKKYGDPGSKSQHIFWGLVDEAIKLALRKMIIIQRIDYAFGSDERSVFWKQYAGSMENAIIAKESNILIMYFSEIVVVEFTQHGNAAYIYPIEFFEKSFVRQLRDIEKNYVVRKESFKAKAYLGELSPRYASVNKNIINAFIHGGDWQYKAANMMSLLGVNRK